jgi:hypothetical protein
MAKFDFHVTRALEDDRISEWLQKELRFGADSPRKRPGPPYKLTATDQRTCNSLRALASILATTKEIAAVLGVHEDTLFEAFKREPRLREIYMSGRETGKASLRRVQFDLAKRNAAMAIFLGKNLLGQSDQQDHRFRGSINVEVADARDRLARLILGGEPFHMTPAPPCVHRQARSSSGHILGLAPMAPRASRL